MIRINRLFMIVRRTLLVILLLILLPYYIQDWLSDSSRGINDPIKAVSADGEFTKLKIGKTMKIDESTFTVDEVYVTTEHILLTYTYHTNQKISWSFPSMTLKLETPDGQVLESHSSGSNGTSWGERGYIWYDMPEQPVESATIIYDHYDRHFTLEIPLMKGVE
ncbi:hypothetical protein PALU110988_20570 [Paenibacillus lupini]|uniref:hypothetical protein n=1 Tax=Paenibacillus lupini TaxID=1450204 RepID=UPI0014235BCA|nr:hypothetical protein [Paenibacillus lupini]NIK21805.1 hypothetical protein [Paenibacillus lupini]